MVSATARKIFASARGGVADLTGGPRLVVLLLCMRGGGFLSVGMAAKQRAKVSRFLG